MDQLTEEINRMEKNIERVDFLLKDIERDSKILNQYIYTSANKNQ